MNILVLNCGSSSLKFQLIQTSQIQIDKDADTIIAKGVIERIGSQALITLNSPSQSLKRAYPIRDHTAAIHYILNFLLEKDERGSIIENISDIDAVGHRVVHGGEYISDSCVIDAKITSIIEDCIDLAPLHNPANLAGIKAVATIFGSIPQVAVFDTAFHQSMPESSYLYSIPYQLYRRHKLRKYGFHGTSHRYVAYRYRKLLKIEKKEVNLITLHLGNGCSICLIRSGQSFDTSMGLTPMEGLVMGTRAGDIDPAAIEYIASKEGIGLHDVMFLLNNQSGLLGISGLTHDMRELLEEEKENGDRRASLAITLFVKRVKQYVGAYLAQSKETSALILCGGIGENSAEIRQRIFQDMEHLGFTLNTHYNANLPQGEAGKISDKSSAREIYVFPTNEELLIARDTFRLISQHQGLGT